MPTPNPQSNTPNYRPPIQNLQSSVGMDYSRLRDLLADGEWKKADKETARVMLYYVRLHAHNKTHAKTQRRKESKNILLWVCYRT
jgi:hypothetical protein